MQTQNEFIKKCIKIHGNKYDYSKVEYNGIKEKIKIVCSTHGIFEQLPYNHLLGKGCNKCNPQFGEKIGEDKFIERSNKIHDNFYDYSLIKNYKNNRTKVKIICPKHGIFEQEPRHHLSGQKCPTCQGNKKLTDDDFIKRSKDIHKNKYDYSLSKINGTHSKTKIICPKHGIFIQIVDSHLRGHGCPKCKDSKGEKIIEWYLIKNQIEFKKQKMFDDCKDIRRLKFDFYLEKYNLCIEYDGLQHFKIAEWGEKKLKDSVKKDTIKNIFCKNNNINLLRISYKENIITKLNEYLNF